VLLSFPMGRIQIQGLPEVRSRFLNVPLIGPHQPEVEIGIGQTRLDCDGLGKIGGRFIQIS